MSLHDWCNHNARKPRVDPFSHPPICGDVIEFPEILVTEEPLNDDTARRFLDAQQRRALELLPLDQGSA